MKAKIKYVPWLLIISTGGAIYLFIKSFINLSGKAYTTDILLLIVSTMIFVLVAVMFENWRVSRMLRKHQQLIAETRGEKNRGTH